MRGGLAFAKEPYLHPRRIPLAEAVRLDQAELAAGLDRDGFVNECEGHCGVGAAANQLSNRSLGTIKSGNIKCSVCAGNVFPFSPPSLSIANEIKCHLDILKRNVPKTNSRLQADPTALRVENKLLNKIPAQQPVRSHVTAPGHLQHLPKIGP